MDEYIKKQDAIDKFEKLKNKSETLQDALFIDGVLAVLSTLPAADVRPVVRGEWKGYTMSAFHGCDDFGEPIYRDVSVYYCSKCNRRTVIKENFCPNCGADMRGEQK